MRAKRVLDHANGEGLDEAGVSSKITRVVPV